MTTTTFIPPLAAPIPEWFPRKNAFCWLTLLLPNASCALRSCERWAWMWTAQLIFLKPAPGGVLISYDLVLINVDKGAGHRDKFCDDIRSATPSQHLAFLVGKPEYLANVPGLDGELPLPVHLDASLIGDVKAALSIDLADLSQRWGIMEASRRISAVRSASNARTKAMRDRPTPPRDLEVRHGKRPADEPPSLDDLLREEMQ